MVGGGCVGVRLGVGVCKARCPRAPQLSVHAPVTKGICWLARPRSNMCRMPSSASPC